MVKHGKSLPEVEWGHRAQKKELTSGKTVTGKAKQMKTRSVGHFTIAEENGTISAIILRQGERETWGRWGLQVDERKK